MLKITLILFTILMFATTGDASPSNKISGPAVHSKPIKIDSSKIDVRNFNPSAIKKYLNDPAFNYEVKKNDLSWWDRFWQWVWDVWTSFWEWVAHLLGKLFGNVSVGRQTVSVIRVVVILLVATLIVYIISKLIGIDVLKFFRKNQAIAGVPYSESLENIHEINFDDAIENALAVKDYRLAVRLLYLRSLKQLSDANLINWKIEKTNYAYLSELKDEEQRRRFSIVTRQFEYVWYGDFPVDGQLFGNISAFFHEFKQSLS